MQRLKTLNPNPVIDLTNSWHNKRWYNDKGLLHRADGPAVWSNGYKAWYLNGKRHRTDGPAIECADGAKHWYLNGIRHRTDGPAIERDWYKAWFLNGKRHRTDGPAIEYANGYKAWYLNGVPHRTDGPAMEYGNKYWYLNGYLLTEDLFLRLTGPVKSLPLYIGLGFDEFISERIKNEPGH